MFALILRTYGQDDEMEDFVAGSWTRMSSESVHVCFGTDIDPVTESVIGAYEGPWRGLSCLNVAGVCREDQGMFKLFVAACLEQE